MRSVENNPPQFTRIPLAAIGFGLGLAVAVYTTRKDQFFLYNFAFTLLPQAAVLCIVLLCKASRESLVAFAWVVLGIVGNLAVLAITVEQDSSR